MPGQKDAFVCYDSPKFTFSLVYQTDPIFLFKARRRFVCQHFVCFGRKGVRGRTDRRPDPKPSEDTNELKTDIKYTGTQLLKKKHDTKHALSEISKRISVLSSNKEIFNNANEEAIKEAIKRSSHV